MSSVIGVQLQLQIKQLKQLELSCFVEDAIFSIQLKV